MLSNFGKTANDSIFFNAMIKQKIQHLLSVYLRKQLKVFTLKDINNFLSQNQAKVSEKELGMLLCNFNYVIQLKNGSFITRAGLFSDYPFSICPSKFEIDNGILIIGHRFMPFVDSEVMPHEIVVNFLGKRISKCIITARTSDITKFYELFGEEYIPQIIAMDPANTAMDLSSNDYYLPKSVELTVLDLKKIYKLFKFKIGDRIHAIVRDWDNSVVEIIPYIQEHENPFLESDKDIKREQWFKNAERGLLGSLKKYGPETSIDEQLVNLYLENRKDLSMQPSGSLEELLEKSDKIGIELYGVESRLWIKGEDVPPASSWYEDDTEEEKLSAFFENGTHVPDFVLDAFILDMFYKKEKDITKIIETLFSDEKFLNKHSKNVLMLHLKKKRDILIRKYNWFADFEIGKVRHQVLDLYLKLLDLGYELSYLGNILDNLSQQPIVIFTQLVEHITRMISVLLDSDACEEKELIAISTSLEGMEFSYDEIMDILADEIKKHQKDIFSVIKKTED